MKHLHTIAVRLASGLALAAIAVSAQAQYSTPIRDVETPARSAYQTSSTVTLDAGTGALIGSSVAEVPEGTRLVVEYVSVRCSSPAGNGIVSVSLGITRRTSPTTTSTLSFPIPIRFQSTTSSGNSVHIGAEPVRLYADPGGGGIGVSASVSRQSGTGTTNCHIALSGHTIDM